MVAMQRLFRNQGLDIRLSTLTRSYVKSGVVGKLCDAKLGLEWLHQLKRQKERVLHAASATIPPHLTYTNHCIALPVHNLLSARCRQIDGCTLTLLVASDHNNIHIFIKQWMCRPYKLLSCARNFYHSKKRIDIVFRSGLRFIMQYQPGVCEEELQDF